MGEASPLDAPVRCRVHARIGLLGNPSDGFQGATIAVSLANFWAEVTAEPSDRVELRPSPLHDPSTFSSLDALSGHVKGWGYYGGVRLIMAACHCFHEHCTAKGIALPNRTFALSYETNIPRQSGLAGSSAITLAALRCLRSVHSMETVLSVHELPRLALQAEASLGITAGPQDRVIQTYGGVLFMDFADPSRHVYRALDPDVLPSLAMVYDSQPSGKDSGSVHSSVKQRWLDGAAEIRAGMAELAALASSMSQMLATKAAGSGEDDRVSVLERSMRANHALRQRLYGDGALSQRSLRMVALADSLGLGATFAGSGGCVVVALPKGPSQVGELQAAAAAEGFACELVRVAPPCADLPGV